MCEGPTAEDQSSTPDQPPPCVTEVRRAVCHQALSQHQDPRSPGVLPGSRSASHPPWAFTAPQWGVAWILGPLWRYQHLG